LGFLWVLFVFVYYQFVYYHVMIWMCSYPKF
jgi:hypothetical protein